MNALLLNASVAEAGGPGFEPSDCAAVSTGADRGSGVRSSGPKELGKLTMVRDDISHDQVEQIVDRMRRARAGLRLEQATAEKLRELARRPHPDGRA